MEKIKVLKNGKSIEIKIDMKSGVVIIPMVIEESRVRSISSIEKYDVSYGMTRLIFKKRNPEDEKSSYKKDYMIMVTSILIKADIINEG